MLPPGAIPPVALFRAVAGGYFDAMGMRILRGRAIDRQDIEQRRPIVVVDQAGYVVASERMDGVSPSNVRFAEGKAFASAMLRATTEALGDLAKSRPDRYHGIMAMYPGKVYLVGGGVPLVSDGKLVGAVGVAGLPQGVDEKAGRAGMAAWEKLRDAKK